MSYKIAIEAKVNEDYAWETLGEAEVTIAVEDFEITDNIPWELICSGLAQIAINRAARTIAKRNQEEDESD
jgi:hypothetical protein